MRRWARMQGLQFEVAFCGSFSESLSFAIPFSRYTHTHTLPSCSIQHSNLAGFPWIYVYHLLLHFVHHLASSKLICTLPFHNPAIPLIA